MNPRQYGRHALATAMALVATVATAVDLPPPFEGRLDEVSVASRRITINGVTYPLLATARIEGQDGRPAVLRAEDVGRWVQVEVDAPDPGKPGPAPVRALKLINQ
jgi:hypothetical protein